MRKKDLTGSWTFDATVHGAFVWDNRQAIIDYYRDLASKNDAMMHEPFDIARDKWLLFSSTKTGNQLSSLFLPEYPREFSGVIKFTSDAMHSLWTNTETGVVHAERVMKDASNRMTDDGFIRQYTFGQMILPDHDDFIKPQYIVYVLHRKFD